MAEVKREKEFTFKISLSVLNHLGRHLYRSFATVLGEAISNSWDADARNVWIYIDQAKNKFVIKDDGIGMTDSDFQDRFLKIGYSKRTGGHARSKKGRAFIGRKGIGKLAMLSCARRVTIISKIKGGEYVGGIIDNKGLDKAITHDVIPDDYRLERPDMAQFSALTREHSKGTIILFEGIHEGIKNSLNLLKKIIALHFRFSLKDPNFKIYLNGEQITNAELEDLAKATEFLWVFNNLEDPYIVEKNLTELKEKKTVKINSGVKGFIASVGKPRDLNIITTDERVGISLFVNGRLREVNILKHIPTSRIAENYLYGQLHFDGLDDKVDRFTSSREGVVADDPKYTAFLTELRKKLLKVIEDWDEWRRKNREDGDSDDPRLSRRERKSGELFNAVSGDYKLTGKLKERSKGKIEGWINALAEDARFNFSSYAECFISENLIRQYIKEKKLPLNAVAKGEVTTWKSREQTAKGKGNISIEIRRVQSDLSYLDMETLAKIVDPVSDPNKEAGLPRDANEYKPMRDAIAHTALLTDAAKQKLSSVYENIKARVKTLLTK